MTGGTGLLPSFYFCLVEAFGFCLVLREVHMSDAFPAGSVAGKRYSRILSRGQGRKKW